MTDMPPELVARLEKVVASPTGIAECDRYIHAMTAFMSCQKLPVQARKSTIEAFVDATDTWRTSSLDARRSIATSCASSVDSLRQTAQRLGCPLEAGDLPAEDPDADRVREAELEIERRKAEVRERLARMVEGETGIAACDELIRDARKLMKCGDDKMRDAMAPAIVWMADDLKAMAKDKAVAMCREGAEAIRRLGGC